METTYGGDEVGAIVLDLGSYSTKCGFSGEDTPQLVVPSYYGIVNNNNGEVGQAPDEQLNAKGSVNGAAESISEAGVNNGNKEHLKNKYSSFKKRSTTIYGENCLRYPRANMEIHSILQDEIIQDWDAATEMFDYLFKSLDCNIKEQPLLLTEPIWNTKKNKLKALELFLEFFETPGFYLNKIPSCISFATGKPNALIVDIGHSTVSVTPVQDGLCLSKNVLKTHYAGQFLDSQIRACLIQRNIDIVPKYKIEKKLGTIEYTVQDYKNNNLDIKPLYKLSLKPFGTTQSFDSFQNQYMYQEFKESMIVVPETTISNPEKFDYQSRNIELSTGLRLELDQERYNIGNSLFDPTKYITEYRNNKQFHDSAEDYDWSIEENGDIKKLDIDNEYVPLKRGKRKRDDEDENSTASTPAPPDITNTTSTTVTSQDSVGSKASKSLRVAGLSELINKSLNNLDIDIRQQSANNIVVTGSLSLIPGLNDRIYRDLSEMNPSLKIRVTSSGNSYERKYQSWLGGSILASLGTFHQLWVSKQEYEEMGGGKIIIERFR